MNNTKAASTIEKQRADMLAAELAQVKAELG